MSGAPQPTSVAALDAHEARELAELRAGLAELDAVRAAWRRPFVVVNPRLMRGLCR